MCNALTHVRFTPNSDRKSRHAQMVQMVMSALPPKADMCGATAEVRFGPIADIQTWALESLKPFLVHRESYIRIVEIVRYQRPRKPWSMRVTVWLAVMLFAIFAAAMQAQQAIAPPIDANGNMARVL
jgi:hypothetical protein